MVCRAFCSSVNLATGSCADFASTFTKKVGAPGTCVIVKAGGGGGRSAIPAAFKTSGDTTVLPGVVSGEMGAERLPAGAAAAKIISKEETSIDTN